MPYEEQINVSLMWTADLSFLFTAAAFRCEAETGFMTYGDSSNITRELVQTDLYCTRG